VITNVLPKLDVAAVRGLPFSEFTKRSLIQRECYCSCCGSPSSPHSRAAWLLTTRKDARVEPTPWKHRKSPKEVFRVTAGKPVTPFHAEVFGLVSQSDSLFYLPRAARRGRLDGNSGYLKIPIPRFVIAEEKSKTVCDTS
jgi:hypothetical protein